MCLESFSAISLGYCGSETQNTLAEYEQNSPKLDASCYLLHDAVIEVHSSLPNGDVYLDLLVLCVIPLSEHLQLNAFFRRTVLQLTWKRKKRSPRLLERVYGP
ncbi:hypothetical protein AVEN_191618-1 [Araneus ventricosus]|uniref:Uncharacterized protein n=1 Tax=Araneus ventricosus TaxID=182803 RepID=A0A4Y2XB45_ARAVE|nr:hypothetical protein AVEN_191618-1 [Araneus ventricosus]